MPFQIVHNDIVKMNTDAIVNAANTRLLEGGGVCGAIFRAAGSEKLQKACDVLAPCAAGDVVLTPGFQLPSKYIIHAVGPVWNGGNQGEEQLLENAYKNALVTAKKAGCRSISFPLISAGIYGYPRQQALKIAMQVFREFLARESDEWEIYLVVMDRKVVEISEGLNLSVQHYLDQYLQTDHQRRMQSEASILLPDAMMAAKLDASSIQPDVKPHEKLHANAKKPAKQDRFPNVSAPNVQEEEKSTKLFGKIKLPGAKKKERKIEELLLQMDETFSEMLLRLIDEKGYTDVEIYKRANMDRKLFSKIRSNHNYTPKKSTILALAIALKLSLDETLDLLGKAGYTLSHSFKQDVIIQYFLEHKEYDIYIINETLFSFEQPIL